MDATIFPRLFPQFPSSDEESSETVGLSKAELAAITVAAVVIIVLIAGCVECFVLRKKNIALRIGNDIQLFTTGAPAAPVNLA